MSERGVTQRVADVAEGDTRETTVTDIERRNFVEYAGASGDFNPIHYDEPFATGAGNESVFAQGMWTAGVASTVITDWFGVGAIREFGTRFQSRVFPGETITSRATITEIDTRGETPTAHIEIEVTNQDDEPAITGTAVATLRSA